MDERLDEYLKRLDEDDVTEGNRRFANEKSRGKNRGVAHKARSLQRDAGRSPDSRAMAAYTKVGVGYNIQIAVDAKNKMIVEQAVSNQVVDTGLLTDAHALLVTVYRDTAQPMELRLHAAKAAVALRGVASGDEGTGD